MACTLLRVVASLATAALLTTPPMAAQDERELRVPVGTVWQANVSANTIATHVAQGYRITDLEVYDPITPRFSVAMVQNTGSYAVSGWWWYYGMTSTQVRDALTQNTARPIDIESYLDSAGTRRFAVVMVSNTGTAAKSWNLFLGSTATSIGDFVSANGHRIVDLDGYTSGTARVYAAITWRNSGTDARSWWWYLGVTQAQVATMLTQNGARLVDLDPIGNGTYDVVMNRTTGVWGYYFGQSTSQVNQLVEQYGRRIVDIERNTSTSFDVIMNINTDGLGTRISQILNNGTTGSLGAFARRIDGNNATELVALNENARFEPASTLKTLPHVYAMHRVAVGATTLGRTASVPLGSDGSCPNGGPPSVSETLEQVLRAMMENSDNARTKKVVDDFGVTNINAHALALGMTNTAINHVFGCGGPTANRTTLRDLGTLHDEVADGHLGNFRANFYDLMVNSRAFPGSGTLSFDTIITAEAASEGVSGELLTAFRSAFVHAAKGGNYDWPSVPRYHGSYFGYVALPFVISGHVTYLEYALGTFFNDGLDKSVNFNAIAAAYCEMLREQIRSALRTWAGTALGTLTYFGQPCAGSNGTPLTTASGYPGIGGSVTYMTTNGPVGMPGAIYLGASRSSWNGLPLPLDLGFVGAGGCSVLTDPAVAIPTLSLSPGVSYRMLSLPSSLAMMGQQFYVQFWMVDPPANALGLITGRGVTTRIGIVP